MDTSRFYSNSKYVTISGDGSVSDDEILASDSDCDYEPELDSTNEIIIDETDSDVSNNDDIESNLPSTSKPEKNRKQENIIWTKSNLTPYEKKNFEFLGNIDLPQCAQELDTPVDFFSFFFTDNLLDYIVEQSNLKALQENINKPANVTKNELQQFIGIVIYMSLVKLPSTRHYWNTSVGQKFIFETMTCNRFEIIKKCLHFNNNDDFKPFGTPDHDKLFKIRPLIEKIRERLHIIPREEFLAIDEQIIPTKTRHQLKQYNPAKPHKWGFKNQVLSGVSGFSYDFEIFAGQQTNKIPDDAPDLGVSGNVVTRLVSTVPTNLNHKLFFDNWFNSPKLQVYLFKKGLLSLGTVRLNRVPNSKMPIEKELKKLGRGSMVEKIGIIDGVKLSLISWYDNKVVTMLSTYVGSHPITTKNRFSKKEKIYKEISCPQAVQLYNQYMGGVDLLDSMLGLYRIHLRSRKWYKRIFFHMIDLCIVNAWILWRRQNNFHMPLFDFKLAISEHLCKCGKSFAKKRGRPAGTPNAGTSRDGTSSSRCSSPDHENRTPTSSKTKRKRPARHQDIPLNSVRTDNIGHLPTWSKNRMLCQNNCKFRSYTVCDKCNIHLCYNDKRNCFTEFHR